MGAPVINTQIINEGVGHGGFYAQIFNNGAAIGGGQYYVVDPFNSEDEEHLITIKDPLGAALAKAAVLVDRHANFTVIIPVTLVGGVPQPVALVFGGYSFTDLMGENWWVLGRSDEYRSGEAWKQNIRCTKKLH